MSRRAVALAVALPVTVGAVVALALFVAGERRSLTVSTALPLLVLGAGALVTVVVAVVTVAVVRRSRAGAAREDARNEGYRAGRDEERDAHRRFLARLDHELKNPITAIRATLAGVDPAAAPRTSR